MDQISSPKKGLARCKHRSARQVGTNPANLIRAHWILVCTTDFRILVCSLNLRAYRILPKGPRLKLDPLARVRKEHMMTSNISGNASILVELDRLSKGIDRILARWPDGSRPTKLTLLNDLAAAIQSGSDWGALKSSTGVRPPTMRRTHADLIPKVSQAAVRLPARLSPVDSDEDDPKLRDLAQNVQPLFTMTHYGDAIIGLALSLNDGNGFCEASIYTKLVLLRDGQVHVVPADVRDLAADAAHLIFAAIQDLQAIELYSVFTQAACGRLHILIGPCKSVGSLPEFYGRGAPADLPTQSLRILIDEGETPSAADLDVLLRLASATLPHLSLKQFPADKTVQFRLTQPLAGVWKPADFKLPAGLDDRTMFLIPGSADWVHNDRYLYKNRVPIHSKLNEALDLALTLIDVDEPDVYLKVALAPEPKNPRTPNGLKPGWRGGLHPEWEIFRKRPGQVAEVLSLDQAMRKRLVAGLNGWAVREGFSLVQDRSQVKAEALIQRSRRRAAHHLKQVEAIMDGADPADEALMQSLGERF